MVHYIALVVQPVFNDFPPDLNTTSFKKIKFNQLS